MQTGDRTWTYCTGSRYRDPVTDSPANEPKYARNRDWRRWNVTKNRVIRVPEAEWRDLGFVAKAEGSDRTTVLRDLAQRHIKTWKRKHPDVLLPSEQAIEPD